MAWHILTACRPGRPLLLIMTTCHSLCSTMSNNGTKNSLPADVWREIVLYVETADLYALSCTSRCFNQESAHIKQKRQKYFRLMGTPPYVTRNHLIICTTLSNDRHHVGNLPSGHFTLLALVTLKAITHSIMQSGAQSAKQLKRNV